MLLSDNHGVHCSEQTRQHLAEFDNFWEKCFSYRGRRRDGYKRDFAIQLTQKLQRMLTVYNNYDTAIHRAEMAQMRENAKARRLQTEVAKLTLTNSNLKDEIVSLRQNGGPQATVRPSNGGTGGTQEPNEHPVGSSTGI